MNARANILARLRRWKTGVGRPVVASFAVAYLAAGVAPCVAASSQAAIDSAGAVLEIAASSHDGNAVQEHGAAPAAPHHGHDAHAGGPRAGHDADDDRPREHCPHHLGGAAQAHHDHSSCSVVEDLSNVAASQQKETSQPPVALVPVAFALLPPLASPAAPPPLRAVEVPPVPLNVRHCVFLI
jgi:hypothetical protein